MNLPMYTNVDVCSKLLKFGNIIFLGDSHMRYKFRFLGEFCHNANPGINLKHVSKIY